MGRALKYGPRCWVCDTRVGPGSKGRCGPCVRDADEHERRSLSALRRRLARLARCVQPGPGQAERVERYRLDVERTGRIQWGA